MKSFSKLNTRDAKKAKDMKGTIMAQTITTISTSLNTILNTLCMNQALLKTIMHTQAQIVANLSDKNDQSVQSEFEQLLEENLTSIEKDVFSLLSKNTDLF
ncbi:hypothetical protein H8E88_02410 [candidate division KSB1 bacterium]|nr:hypothetical protein [candidate division KSB1 bacterium]